MSNKFQNQRNLDERWSLCVRRAEQRVIRVMKQESQLDNQPDGFKSEDADAIKEQGGSA